MACQRCRPSLLSRLQLQHTVPFSASRTRQLPIHWSQFRNYSDDNNSIFATPPPPSPNQPITVTSPATPDVSEPPSTPAEAPINASPKKKKRTHYVPRLESFCLPGTKLTGLNYFKNQPEIVALEDSEYPDWLWELVAKKRKYKTLEEIDRSTLKIWQQKIYDKKMAARLASRSPRYPVHHHATDLVPAHYNRTRRLREATDDQPTGGQATGGQATGDEASGDTLAEATESLEMCSEITKSAREARRKAIKEANFLRGL
ncbi:mitochondrial ribosomal protein L37-domain-containing protein [Aspergillus coremiiformis]|uniref:Large ribosomal subunit protein mL54 n=1 Tax=Aspergillus coremiiformis TaxID=138285 RepID=A0A5N6Z2Z8_9EURO|nr:mitochondrial ribosomal protein L37-domain-containing protein [Aspergillus coremiiformis]